MWGWRCRRWKNLRGVMPEPGQGVTVLGSGQGSSGHGRTGQDPVRSAPAGLGRCRFEEGVQAGAGLVMAACGGEQAQCEGGLQHTAAAWAVQPALGIHEPSEVATQPVHRHL